MEILAARIREGETVILCAQGPVDGGIARLAIVSSVARGFAWVEGRQFPVDAPEPWDVPINAASAIRYVLKRDTPENRRAHGVTEPA